MRFILTLILPLLVAASTVNCTGQIVEKDPNDPKYRILAEESLVQHADDTDDVKDYDVVKVNSASEQTVAGTITRIDFIGTERNCYPSSLTVCNTISCHSEIWEREWLNKKDITVQCIPILQ